MGRGTDPLSPLVQSRLRRTSTDTDDDSSSEEDSTANEQNETDGRSTNELTATQEQMLEQVGGREYSDLPGKYEPETVENSEESDSIDPFEQRLRDKAEEQQSSGPEYSRPEIGHLTAPSSGYELFDPSSTRTTGEGLDTAGPWTPPSSPQRQPESSFPDRSDISTVFRVNIDRDPAQIVNREAADFREAARDAITLRDQALDEAKGAIEEGDIEGAQGFIDAAKKLDEKAEDLNKAADASDQALEASLKAAAAERQLEQAKANVEQADAVPESDETKTDQNDLFQPPDEFVDPEKVQAMSEYLREQTGYDGPVRDGDIDWDDQQEDSTGGSNIDRSDLYGGRPEGELGQAEIPDGPIVLGNDHDINWGPDAGNPGSGLNEDVPANVGRTGDLSHLDPSSQSDDGDRAIDRTIRPAGETKTQAEGPRAEAEERADRLTIVREAPADSNTTMSALSTGSESGTIDLSGENGDSESDGESENSSEDGVLTFNSDGTVTDDEGAVISGTETSEDNGTIVFTGGDGQTAETVSTGSATTAEEEPAEEESAAPSPAPIFTAVEGRPTADDLRDISAGRDFFDDEPAEAVAEEPAAEAPEPETAEATARFQDLPDLRVPSPLDDIQPMRTLEPVGSSDDDGTQLDDE